MNSNTTHTRYNTVSQFLHWLTLLLILGMYATAWGRDFMSIDYKALAMPLHKSLGITILAVTSFRIFWRLSHKPPLPPLGIPCPMMMAASATHFMLYGFLVAVPVFGWLMISAWGRPMEYFGLVELPSLIEKNRILGVTFKNIHETGATVFFCFIGLHILAALYHQFVREDGLLDRMLPGKTH